MNENEKMHEMLEEETEIVMEQDTDPLAVAQAEIESLKDKHLRVVAEMQNMQRRAQRDIDDANKYGVISSAKPFLAVADNLDRALQNLPAEMPANMTAFVDGIRATQRDLQIALDKMGVKPIEAEAGHPLNPHEHEVMFEVPTADHAHGSIVQVLEMGYKIHDRLLRPARVSVAKNTNGGDATKAMDVSA